MKKVELDVEKILIFRIGFLGDTLVSLPAISVIREKFPDAGLFLLSQRVINDKRVIGNEIFDGSGIFEDYIGYPVDHRFIGKFLLPFYFLKLSIQLKKSNFDKLVYLSPSRRTKYQIVRDRFFFNLVGIKEFIGMEGFQQILKKVPGKSLPEGWHEADLLLDRLRASGFNVPPRLSGKMDLNLNENEEERLQKILSQFPGTNDRRWLGIGPGGKKQVSIWPSERYLETVRKLIEKYKVWPVIFGGEDDREIGEELVKAWGCGYNLAGVLPVRLSALALRRCQLYLGNDTGTIHLAALAKVPCVGIYSSHEYPGRWYPYGVGHKVFRTPIECEGCGLFECIEKKKECILSIRVEEVLKACEVVLDQIQKIEKAGPSKNDE